ncbi:FMN-binding negative transcriptional regulator [Alicyclobacillus sendaiensis]|uniref:FMN-binding negative transcriptional regulator n=1 Tax=Alicyclobacillus sendaiensis PA2 TaxID=3029425 RepID=A0ABT6XUC3_ALISE|nr:FMN-binding negative transcriptional regulator [Alicyclobacillus sendaiensis]MDI9258684.1 FMN-binding negative transcriptional regulator [Alicyclobacillus sendaiensis PA2]
MYIPTSFQLQDAQLIETVLREHSFALLVTSVGEDMMATHAPLVYDPAEAALFGHLARANPQAKCLHEAQCLAIFQGPHAYISPAWYGLAEQVPTWNYVAVHVYGRAKVMEDEEAAADLLDRLLLAYDPQSPLPAERDRPYYRNLMRGIVPFRIDIERIEAAAKLSQNKPLDVRRRVVEALESLDDADARAVAAWMRRLVLARPDGAGERDSKPKGAS